MRRCWRFCRHRMRTAIRPTANGGMEMLVQLFDTVFSSSCRCRVVTILFYFVFYWLISIMAECVLYLFISIVMCSAQTVPLAICVSAFSVVFVYTILYHLNSSSIIKLSPIFGACLLFTSVDSLHAYVPNVVAVREAARVEHITNSQFTIHIHNTNNNSNYMLVCNRVWCVLPPLAVNHSPFIPAGHHLTSE